MLLVGLCALGVAFAQIGPGRRVAEAIGISSPAEPFTELYFKQPAELGSPGARSDSAQTPHRVSFAIRSHERTARTYTWTIATDRERRLVAGTVAVRAGGGAVIKRTVRACPSRGTATTPNPPARRVQIRVALADPEESISYWTQCHG